MTVDYLTAKAIIVDGNPQAGMQAFMAGKIKVQGDMTKMMALQAGGAGPGRRQGRRAHPGDHRVGATRRGRKNAAATPPIEIAAPTRYDAV